MVAQGGETLNQDRVRAFAAAALARTGMSEEDSSTVADALVWADLRGLSPQGLAKLPIIVARLQAGGNTAKPRITTIRETAAMTVIDADDEWGHVSGVRAMRRSIEKARTAGIGLTLVRNTSSGSAMGYYPTLAVEQGMIGFAINSTTPVQAPHGGTTKIMGNQAFALAAPAGKHPPLLFDTATTALTWTSIDKLRDEGKPLPQGLALDAQGRPTVDHDAAIAGILLPMAGHRGFGLALMWEVLTGVLGGSARFGKDVTPLSELDAPQSVSHFMLAIDPRFSMPAAEFTARVDAVIDQIHASPPAPGFDQVYAPGERGFATAAARARNGIPYPGERLAEVRALGEKLGVTL